jgi:hypothetical protein
VENYPLLNPDNLLKELIQPIHVSFQRNQKNQLNTGWVDFSLDVEFSDQDTAVERINMCFQRNQKNQLNPG